MRHLPVLALHCGGDFLVRTAEAVCPPDRAGDNVDRGFGADHFRGVAGM